MITDLFLRIPCWSHEAIHPTLSAYHVGSAIYVTVRSAGEKYRAPLLTRSGVHLLLQSPKFRCLPTGWVPGQKKSSQYSQWRVKRVWVDGHLRSHKVSSSPALIYQVSTIVIRARCSHPPGAEVTQTQTQRLSRYNPCLPGAVAGLHVGSFMAP